MKEITDWEDIPSPEINDWEDVKPVSKLESGARGAIQGLSLGFGDEIAGAAESAAGSLGLVKDKTYEQARDESRANNRSAQEANPVTYGAGQVAGAVGEGLATGGTSVGGMAALGAAQGLGSSESEDIAGMARDTAVGGAIGAVTGGVAKGIGALAPKVTTALEEVATNPMVSKVAALQPQARMSGMASDVMKKIGVDVPGLDQVASITGNTVGRKAAYAIPGVNLAQGVSDAAKVAQKGAQITLEKIIPQMGKYTKPLQDAAARSASSLAVSHHVLMQSDAEYRETYKKAQEQN